jgi:hypothetical protein
LDRSKASRGDQSIKAFDRLRRPGGMDRGGAEEQAKQNGGHGCDDGDESEWKKVAELRAVIEAKDPAAKVPLRIIHVSIFLLINFLPASPPPLSTDDSREVAHTYHVDLLS